MLDKLSRIALPVVILALGITAMFWLRSQKKQPSRTKTEPKPDSVRTVKIAPAITRLNINTFGVVTPRRVTTISAQLAGRVTFKDPAAVDGRYVEANASLLRIDPEPYRLRAAIKEEASKQAKRQLQQLELTETQTKQLLKLAERQVKIADDELTRTKLLAKRNAAAEAEVNRVEQILLRSQQSKLELNNILGNGALRRLEIASRIAVAGADLSLAQMDVARADVKAPHAGILASTMVEEGEYVQPGDLLFKLEQTQSLEIEFQLKARQLSFIWQSDGRAVRNHSLPPIAATIQYSANGRSYQWVGKLDRILGKGINKTTQVATCRATIAKTSQSVAGGPPMLIKGMFVEVALELPGMPSMLSIPITAWRPNRQVWIVSDNKIVVHTVDPIQFRTKDVLIRASQSGPQPGDSVIVSSVRAAYTGMPVEVTSTGSSSDSP